MNRRWAWLPIACTLLGTGCHPPPVLPEAGTPRGSRARLASQMDSVPAPNESPCVLDAIADVRSLEPDPSYSLAYHSGNSPESHPSPTLSNGRLGHRQSIARMHIPDGRDAGNYLLVSASTRADDPGFEVVRLAERRDDGAIGAVASAAGSAPAGFRVVDWIVHERRAFGTNYNHAGGLQTMGRVVAVALEAYQLGSPSPAGFQLWSLGPTAYLAGDLIRREHVGAGGAITAAASVGIVRYDEQTTLALLFGRDALEVEVFVHQGAELRLDAAAWTSRGAWRIARHVGTLAHATDRWRNYQNTQLLRQCDGRIFLLGTTRIRGSDWAHLWRVDFDASFKPTFRKVAERHLYCASQHTKRRRYCDFAAGAGPFIDGRGRLLVYAVERYACVDGTCGRRLRTDGRFVGVREFVPRRRAASNRRP